MRVWSTRNRKRNGGNTLKTFQKVMDGVTFVEKVITTLLLAVISVVTLGSVISRFTPTVTWSFTEELVINLFVPLSLLPEKRAV